MGHRRTLSAVTVSVLAALVAPTLAQPPTPPADITAPPRSSHQPVSKSDEHRIVGKVLHVDREGRLVKLATDEGVLVVEVSSPALQAFRVGDIVSVPRSGTESPSASPRNK
jgi:hypothetical protein